VLVPLHSQIGYNLFQSTFEAHVIQINLFYMLLAAFLYSEITNSVEDGVQIMELN